MKTHSHPFALLIPLLIACLLVVAALGLLGPVRIALAATTITVNTTTDELSANLTCSLREAITNFNNATNSYPECGYTSDPVMINLAAETYALTLTTTNEDANANGDLGITHASGLTMNEVTSATTILQNAAGADRILELPNV